jgi:hypothetical protein
MPSEALMNCGLSSTTFCFVWIASKDIGVAGSFDLQLTRKATMPRTNTAQPTRDVSLPTTFAAQYCCLYSTVILNFLCFFKYLD